MDFRTSVKYYRFQNLRKVPQIFKLLILFFTHLSFMYSYIFFQSQLFTFIIFFNLYLMKLYINRYKLIKLTNYLQMIECISKYNKYTNSNSNSRTILVSKNYHEVLQLFSKHKMIQLTSTLYYILQLSYMIFLMSRTCCISWHTSLIRNLQYKCES